MRNYYIGDELIKMFLFFPSFPARGFYSFPPFFVSSGMKERETISRARDSVAFFAAMVGLRQIELDLVKTEHQSEKKERKKKVIICQQKQTLSLSSRKKKRSKRTLSIPIKQIGLKTVTYRSKLGFLSLQYVSPTSSNIVLKFPLRSHLFR